MQGVSQRCLKLFDIARRGRRGDTQEMNTGRVVLGDPSEDAK
jgi:hypothetical protein